jgi:hypothetical protein
MSSNHIFLDLLTSGSHQTFFTDSDREAIRKAFTGFVRVEVDGGRVVCEVVNDGSPTGQLEVSIPLTEITCLRMDLLPADLVRKLLAWHRGAESAESAESGKDQKEVNG